MNGLEQFISSQDFGEPKELSQEGSYEFRGVPFSFENWTPTLVEIRQDEPIFSTITNDLLSSEYYKPTDLLVIFDGRTPRFIVLSGVLKLVADRGTDIEYILSCEERPYLLEIDPQGRNPIIQGHKLIAYQPSMHREAGKVTITKDEEAGIFAVQLQRGLSK